MSDFPQHWWIADPPGHRSHENVEAEARKAETEEAFGGIPVIVITGDPEDWVCDLCSTPLRLRNDEGVLLPVPMLRGKALCRGCFRANGGKFEALSLSWGGIVCGCPPCSARMDTLAAAVHGG